TTASGRDPARRRRGGVVTRLVPPSRSGTLSLQRRRCVESIVIPGLGGAESPESMNTGLWNMDSGLTAARRPGMTERGGNKKAGEDGTSPAFLSEWRRCGD